MSKERARYKIDKSLITFNVLEEAKNIIRDEKFSAPARIRGAEEIDFFALKSTLLASFNFFSELDLKFQTRELIELKKELLNGEKAYKLNKEALVNPTNEKIRELLYNNSERFQKILEKIETNKHYLSQIESEIDALDNLVSKKKAENNGQASQEIKRLNGKLVDTIHYASLLKEELTMLKGFLYDIEKTEFPKIKSILEERGDIFLKDFRMRLDRLAWKFELEMWKSAKESPLILAFIERSGIKGTPSVYTRLKYATRNLKKTTVGNKDKKKEFDRITKIHKRTAIIINDSSNTSFDEASFVRIVQSANMYVEVECISPNTYRHDFSQAIKEDPKVFFIHYKTILNHHDILEDIGKKYPETAIIVLYKREREAMDLFWIHESKKAKVKYYINLIEREDKIQEMVSEILLREKKELCLA